MRPDRVLALDTLPGWAEYAAARATTKRARVWRQPWAQDETIAWLNKNPQWSMGSAGNGKTDAPDAVRKVCRCVVQAIFRKTLPEDVLRKFAEHLKPRQAKNGAWLTPARLAGALAWLNKNPQWSMGSAGNGKTDAPDAVQQVCNGLRSAFCRNTLPEDVLRKFAEHLKPRKAKRGAWNTPALLAGALAWLNKNPQWSMHSVVNGGAKAPDAVRQVCAGLVGAIFRKTLPEDVRRMFAEHLKPRKAKRGAWNTPALLDSLEAYLKANHEIPIGHTAKLSDEMRKVCEGLTNARKSGTLSPAIQKRFAPYWKKREVEEHAS